MPCPMNAEEWNAAAQEVLTIANQGNNDPFLLDFLCAVYDDLTRKYNERNDVQK